MTPEPVIRAMQAADVPAAMAVLSQWNLAPFPPTPDIPDPYDYPLRVDNSFVAVLGGTVIGVASFVVYEPGFAMTASLAVDRGHRGKGIGTRLQRARLAAMKARGVKRVRTEIDRPDTIAWYVRKFGYRVVGRIRKKHPFSLADVDELTVLELDLA